MYHVVKWRRVLEDDISSLPMLYSSCGLDCVCLAATTFVHLTVYVALAHLPHPLTAECKEGFLHSQLCTRS